MLQQWQKQPELRWVVGMAIAFFVILSAIALHRYYNFYPTYVAFDQGIFNQVFWNGLHGRFFQSSLSSTLSAAVTQDGQVPEVFYHRLGQHFTPALLLWLPIYALFPSPALLSVLQVALMTVAGLVLYALARHYHTPPLAVMLAASFYGAAAVIGPTVANFHDLCQIPLFIFGLLLAMEKRWWWLFWLLAGLTLLVREDAGVVLFSVGFYLAVSRRHLRAGVGVCALSVAYMLLVTNWAMPLFSPDISRRFMVEQFGHFVGNREASSLQVIGAIATQPLRLIQEIITPVDRTISYLLAHWLPLAFVPAVAPAAWLVAGFPLLQNFMRQDPTALSIDLRYALTVIPGFFYGTVLWWAKHPGAFTRRFRRFWIFCLSVSLILTLVSNPNRALSFLIPDSFQPWVYSAPQAQWQHAAAIRSLMAQIPPSASVSATTHIVPHLSNRREIVRFPALQVRNDARTVIGVDYVILDFQQLRQYQVVFDDDRRLLKTMVPVVDRMLGDRSYGLVGFRDGVLLMQRSASSEPTAAAAWSTFRQELEPILRQPD